jgi:hypothetical protein
MLQLTAAALGKVTAWRRLVVRPEGERAVVEHGVAGNAERDVAAARRDSIPTRGNADDELVHNAAMAWGMASASSSAINCGPAISAARP